LELLIVSGCDGFFQSSGPFLFWVPNATQGFLYKSRSGLFFRAAQGCLLKIRSGLFMGEPLRAVYLAQGHEFGQSLFAISQS
jgi:hypothetical protein